MGKARYFEHFPTVELQSTFYEPPSHSLAAKWRALAPEDFHICMKAWQLITHEASSPTFRRLKSKLSTEEHGAIGRFRPTEQVWLAWERTAAVARVLRVTVVLFQCPGSFLPTRENIANFRSFFAQVEREEFLLAWEPRGEWPGELVRDLCSEFELLHCVDPFANQQVYGAGYWRLHGRGGYRYRYTDQDLKELAAMQTRQSPMYVLFNNVWMKDDALRFQSGSY